MNELEKLRAKYKASLESAKAIQAGAKAEGRDLTDEQSAKVDAYLDEAEGHKAEIAKLEAKAADDKKRQDRLAQMEEEGRQSAGRQSAPTNPEPQDEHARVSGGTPRFTQDPMKGFKTPKEFFSTVMQPTSKQAEDQRLAYLATAGSDEQQAGDNPYGGFLVPEGMSPDLLTTPTESNPIAGRTMNVPMDKPTIKINARTDKDHTTSVSGGLTVGRKAETASAAASRMEVEQIKLEANSQFGFAYATEELLRDSPRSVAALLGQGFNDEFLAADLNDFLRGTGVGEPEGILISPAKISVAKEGSQDADTINGTNILKMRARAWRYSQCIWLANHDCLPQLALANIAGAKSDAFLFNPSRGEDVPDMLLGRPIYFSEYANTVGDEGDLVLVNTSQYLTGTYQPLESAESIHVRFDRHERAFKFWRRNDGRSWWRAPLTPKKGAASLSPIVTLAVRG